MSATAQKPPVFSNDTKIVADLTADSDLSSSTYLAVKVTSTGIAVCGSGENYYGILYNAPTSGQYAEVARNGQIMTGIASAAIVKGALIKPAAAGQLVTASSGDSAIGTALTAASGAGVLFTFTAETQKAA